MRKWTGLLGIILVTTGPAAAQTLRVTPSVVTPEIDGKTLDQWIKQVYDPDPSERVDAINAIVKFGPAGKKAVPALIPQLNPANDLSPLVNATIACGQVISDDPRVAAQTIDALAKLIDHSQGMVRLYSITALGRFGPAARNVMPRILPKIRDVSSWEIRRAAAYTIGQLGRDEVGFPDMRAMTTLADGIDDRCKEVRIESLQGLVQLGAPTNPNDAIQLKGLLERRLKVDKDKLAAVWVRVAIMQLDPTTIAEPYVNYLVAQLKSTDTATASQAAKALGVVAAMTRYRVTDPSQIKTVELVKGKIPDLIQSLQSADSTTIICAAWALGQYGPDAASAIGSLNTLLQHPDGQVKDAAQGAIKQIQMPKAG